MRSFFATTVDDWTEPSGQLHAYISPGPALRHRLERIGRQLEAFEYLGVQPSCALHSTLQRFPFFIKDLRVGELEKVADLARAMLANSGPVRVEWSNPTVTDESVIVRGTSKHWDDLLGIVQEAALLLGPRATHYQPSRSAHMTVAYALADAPAEPVIAALEAGTEDWTLCTEKYRSIEWCAVHQYPEKGRYTFEVMASSQI